MHPIIYIIINGELKMSAGKVASQAAHAVMSLGQEAQFMFLSSNRRTVIVLEAKNAEQIKNLDQYLSNEGIGSIYYIDEGVNEIDPYSVTALAVSPIEKDDLRSREIFENFPLYGQKGDKRLWHL